MNNPLDLIGAIIDYHTNGTETEIVALRDLVPAGRMFSDFDFSNRPRPYINIDEKPAVNMGQAQGSLNRVDEKTIQFEVFAETRSQAVAIVDAIENAYGRKVLEATNGLILGIPRFEGSFTDFPTDHRHGLTNAVYYLEKYAS